MSSRRRDGTLLPHCGPRRATFAVALAIVSAALAVGGYQSIRDERLDAFNERSRDDAELFLALLLPDLPAAQVPDLLEAYNGQGRSDTVALVGEDVVVSRPGLGLREVPRGLPTQVQPGRTVQAETIVLGTPYLVIGGQPPRPDTQIYFFYPRNELFADLTALRWAFAGGWMVVAVLAVAVTYLVARRRIRAMSLAHERERRFTADIAHELRTPLGAMVTAASLVHDELPTLPYRIRRPTEVLVTETRRLRQLVEDLMELARLEAGHLRLHVERLSLASAVTAVVRARGWESKVSLDLDERVVVAADRTSLTRIILNLLSNGLQHGGDGVQARVWRDRETAVLEVADAGPGIPPADLPHVFDRFYKADVVRSAGGSGLGLAIARENADLLGGSLEVQSALGSGTRFTFRLRATEPLLKPDESAVSAASRAGA